MECTVIYLITNCYDDPNKIYIGKTKNPKTRELEHKRIFGDQINYSYIDEVDSFDREYWMYLESYWIEQFRQWGFDIQNKNKGGGGPSFQPQSMKDSIRKANTGNKYNLGIKQSKETISKRFKNMDWVRIGLKISNAKKGKTIFSEEWKEKMRKPKGPMSDITKIKIHKSQIGKPKPKTQKKIIQLDKNDVILGVWDSVTKAGIALNIRQGDISAVLHNKQKTAGGFKFKFDINNE